MQNQIRIVGTFNYEDGKFVSVNKNKQDFQNGQAIPIPADQIKNYYPLRSDSQLVVGGGLNHITLKAGETYFVRKGRRVIVEATKDHVIFIQISETKVLPGFFIQTPSGFHQEWLDLIRANTAQNLSATQVLAEWEVQFLVGMVAGSGWKGLTLVIGADLFEEAITKKKTKATKDAIRTLQVLLTFRKELTAVAPTLTSVITDIVWLSLLKGQEQHLLPAMTSDPKIAARAAGTITAQLGKQALDRRLTISSFIWSVLSQLGVKGVMTIPAAISDTVDSFEPTDAATVIAKLDEMLHTIDIVLSDAEKKAIIRELEQNPGKIRGIFEKMLKNLKSPPM